SVSDKLIECGPRSLVSNVQLWLWLFFFQAEDGIRDWSVTGVQTCALPIYLENCQISLECVPGGTPTLGLPDKAGRDLFDARESRSEERRVGKECRARWSPDR